MLLKQPDAHMGEKKRNLILYYIKHKNQFKMDYTRKCKS